MGDDENDQVNQQTKPSFSALPGMLYQTSLTMLLFIRGVLNNPYFRLETKLEEAGCFDDIVFTETDGSYRLIRVKHFSRTFPITFEDIFENELGSFNLLKYIMSYIKIIQEDRFQYDSIKDVIIFTNAHLGILYDKPKIDKRRDRKEYMILPENINLPENDTLYLKNVAPSVKYYKFNTEEVVEIVLDIWKKIDWKKQRYGRRFECIKDEINEQTVREALNKIIYAVSQPAVTTIFETISSEMEERLKLHDNRLFLQLKNELISWMSSGSVFLPTITYEQANEFIISHAKISHLGVQKPPDPKPTLAQIDQIDQILNKSTNVIIIGGVDGLVQTYIETYGKVNYCNRIIQINAINNEKIQESFENLAVKFDIKNPNDTKKLIVNFIKNFTDTKVLFVFETVEEDLEEKNDYVTYFLDEIENSKNRPHVIITTRSFKYKTIPILELESVTFQEIVRWVKKRRPEIEINTAKELATELHKTLNKNQVEIHTVMNYIEVLGITVPELINVMKDEQIQAYSTKNGFILLLALELIEKKDDVRKNSAIKILNVLAYLYAKKIPVRVQSEIFENIECALELLQDLFLITFDSPSKEMVIILPTVQYIIREKIVRDGLEKESLENVLKTLESFIKCDDIDENLKEKQVENVMRYALDCEEIVKLNYKTSFLHGKKMMHYAAYFGNLKAIETIYAAKGDLNVQDNNKKTPLDIALERGMFEVLFFLLIFVDLDFQKKENKEALYSLFAGKQLKFIQFLLMDDSIEKSLRSFLVTLFNINKDITEDLQNQVVVMENDNKPFKYDDLEEKLIEFFQNKRNDYIVMPYLQMIFSREENIFIEEIKEKIKEKIFFLQDDKLFEALLKFTLLNGYKSALKFLLENRNVDLNSKACPVLVIAVKLGYYIEWSIREQYYSCIDLILSYPSISIKINALDQEGNTALHVTKDEKILQKLFAKNISIAYPNKEGEYPFQNVTAERFDAEINSMVTTYLPSYIMKDPKIFNLVSNNQLCLENFIFIDYRKLDPLIDESSIIWFIKKLTEEKHLAEKLNHCVIETVLNLFWKNARYSIALDRDLICLMMLLTIFQFQSFFTIERPELRVKFRVLYFIIVVYVALGHIYWTSKRFSFRKHFLKYWTSKRFSFRKHFLKYWNSKFPIKWCLNKTPSPMNRTEENNPLVNCEEGTEMLPRNTSANSQNQNQPSPASVECTTYNKVSKVGIYILVLDTVFLFFVLLHNGMAIFDDPPVWILAITSIVLSMELSLICAYFSKTIAIYMIMLLTVMKSSFRFLISTFIVLLGFTYTLMTLIVNFNEFKNQKKADDNENATMTDTFIEFIKDFSRGFTRTLIMTIGELDATDLCLDNFMTYFVFILFIFIVSIVFINLLNGLAIDDVQKIQQNAEYEYRKFKLEILLSFGLEKFKDFVTIGIDKKSLKIYSFEMDKKVLTDIKFINEIEKSSLNKLLEIITQNNKTSHTNS